MKRTYQPSNVRRKRTFGFLLKIRSAKLNSATEKLGTSFVQSLKLGASELERSGRPAYVYDEKYPSAVVRKYPDGRKELVQMTKGRITVIKAL